MGIFFYIFFFWVNLELLVGKTSFHATIDHMWSVAGWNLTTDFGDISFESKEMIANIIYPWLKLKSHDIWVKLNWKKN